MIAVNEAGSVIAELRRRDLFELLDSVCRRHGLRVEELCGAGRARSVAYARHELWWRIRALPDRHYSYPEIARMFRRPSTTIFNGVASYQRFIDTARPARQP